jgi:hypothetical protein
MKHIIIGVLLFLFPVMFVNAQLLTPELVISGGYYSHEWNALFQEKDGKEIVKGTVKSTMSKKDAFNSLITFIVLNKHTIILERDDRVIFSVKKNVGKELVSTPVNVFERSQSKVSFTVTVDYNNEGDYSYTIANILNWSKKLITMNIIKVRN